MRLAMGLAQAADQRRVPGQARELRIVIEVDRDRPLRGRRDDGADIGGKPVVRHALVIEGRQHQRAGEAELGGMAGELHRIGGRRRAGPHHHDFERQAGGAIGVHHRLALGKRERGRFPGGAEHVEAVAAVAEKKMRERGGAAAIGLAVLVDRGRDGGDDPTQGWLRHVGLQR